jgi:hypothetical protein
VAWRVTIIRIAAIARCRKCGVPIRYAAPYQNSNRIPSALRRDRDAIAQATGRLELTLDTTMSEPWGS